MVTVNLHCPRCQSVQVYRRGQNPKRHDRFRGRDWHRVFRPTYCYVAQKTGTQTQTNPHPFYKAW
ncbi:IS1 family transposase, partial [Escherichia coli]|uniref:IS1 family transposase n=1 Tax=Escherichia coli TaxID=562 RepID=UPI0032DA41BE